jgi:hypothetical protein
MLRALLIMLIAVAGCGSRTEEPEPKAPTEAGRAQPQVPAPAEAPKRELRASAPEAAPQGASAPARKRLLVQWPEGSGPPRDLAADGAACDAKVQEFEGVEKVVRGLKCMRDLGWVVQSQRE